MVFILMVLLVLRNVLKANLRIINHQNVKVNRFQYFNCNFSVCHAGCKMCTGPTNSECSSCISGYFHYSNSSDNFCLRVCPQGYKPNYKSNECEPLLSDLSKAQEVTLRATPVVISVAFFASSVIAGGLSINLMVCLVATESLANMNSLCWNVMFLCPKLDFCL